MTTTTIKAPMPGVFYRRPDPDDPVFVEEGDHVEEGDVIGVVGVMKSFQDIKSDASGTVSKILVENEAAIEAGDDLVELELD
ncbi:MULTISPECIES: acetyl-CoA carboxylase [Haloferax]|uniref:Biotin carboxyl carrier protein of acetyl-CoA carboxylase n=2 Tax=Haloferax TaxID=2251 RepID=A0A6G1Z696_9EURY|nr:MULTISPECIES: acetyl-CoA carboxylase [Haloferax]KAB1185442.1 biotin carboxyl carrier domain-containing protein [Haloferax sp. CBA1149]MRW82089.1 biotin carboxyl carrier domain-containing protein [Haloferax marinisediminis]